MAYSPERQSSRAVVLIADPNTKFLLESLPYNPKQKCFVLPAFGPGSRRQNLRKNDWSTQKSNTGFEERTGRDKKESGSPSSPTLPEGFGNQEEGGKTQWAGWAGNSHKWKCPGPDKKIPAVTFRIRSKNNLWFARIKKRFITLFGPLKEIQAFQQGQGVWWILCSFRPSPANVPLNVFDNHVILMVREYTKRCFCIVARYQIEIVLQRPT